MRALAIFGCLVFSVSCLAQTPGAASAPGASDVAPFVSVSAATFVLDHVRVVDGTGAEAKEDQASSSQMEKFSGWGRRRRCRNRAARWSWIVRDTPVIPGLVGMHDHLYYTDSITLQTSSGRLEEPGLLWRRFLTLRRDSTWRPA